MTHNQSEHDLTLIYDMKDLGQRHSANTEKHILTDALGDIKAPACQQLCFDHSLNSFKCLSHYTTRYAP